MEIEGTASKRFRIYTLDKEGNLDECVCEFDTVAEVRWPPRLDKKHKIRFGNNVMTKIEFGEWTARQKT